MVKVKDDITGWNMWEHGVPESRLSVIKQAEDYIKPNGKHEAQYLCKCNCDEHNIIVVRADYVKSGHTTSCGCIQKEKISQISKKYNDYDLTNKYGVGYCSNTKSTFYFDLEDYELIKNYCWSEYIDKKTGYHSLRAYDTNSGKIILMHYLLGYKNGDHIDRNPLNNQKDNLRIATHQENSCNRGIYINNTSGITGVYWDKQHNKWRARINVDNKNVNLGLFVKKEDAIKVRLQAEAQYFGEFSPQKHLFEEYNIIYEG